MQGAQGAQGTAVSGCEGEWTASQKCQKAKAFVDPSPGRSGCTNVNRYRGHPHPPPHPHPTPPLHAHLSKATVSLVESFDFLRAMAPPSEFSIAKVNPPGLRFILSASVPSSLRRGSSGPQHGSRSHKEKKKKIQQQKKRTTPVHFAFLLHLHRTRCRRRELKHSTTVCEQVLLKRTELRGFFFSFLCV